MTYAPPEPKNSRNIAGAASVQRPPSYRSPLTVKSPAELVDSLEREAASAVAHIDAAGDMGLVISPSANPLRSTPPLSGGQPLAEPVRRSLGEDLGVPLPEITVHNDARAHEMAAAMRARAMTIGRHIVFGQGEFNVAERAHRVLMHEAVHVLQHEGRTPASRLLHRSGIPPLALADPDARATTNAQLTALLRALEMATEWAVPASILDVIDVEATDYRLDSTLETALLANATRFGRDPAIRVRDVIIALKQASSVEIVIGPSNIPKEMAIRQDEQRVARGTLVDPVEIGNQIGTPTVGPGGTDAAIRKLQQMVTGVVFLAHESERQLKRLEPGDGKGLAVSELREALERHVSIKRAMIANRVAVHDLTLSAYVALEQMFAVEQQRLATRDRQAAIDRIAEQLTLLRRLNETRIFALEPTPGFVRVGSWMVQATITERLGDYQAVHRDFFGARTTAVVDYYGQADPHQIVNDKSLSFDQLLDVRADQAALLSRLHGVTPSGPNGAAGGTAGPQSTSPEAIVARATGLKLHSEADWRQFVGELYLKLRQEGDKPGDALSYVSTLLTSYLSAFAMSSPFNILDKDPTYLGRPFPRALSGQMIHDCGVFALKVAYILSLLTQVPELQALGLRLEYIVLPGHISVALHGEGLPLFVFNNNQVKIYPAEQWSALLADDVEAGRKKMSRDEAIGTLAAQSFIPGVEMPYRHAPLEKKLTGDRAMDAKAATQALARRGDVFPADDPASQTSMLEYLKLSEEDTRKLQKEVTPMVNKEVEKLWTEVQGDLSARFTAMQKADRGAFNVAREMYKEAADRYNAGVDLVLAKIRKIYGYDFTNETSVDVGRTAEVKSFNGRANNPRLAPGAALSRNSALSGPLAEPWQTVRFHALQQHAEDVLSIAGMEWDKVRKLQPTHPGLQPPIRFSED